MIAVGTREIFGNARTLAILCVTEKIKMNTAVKITRASVPIDHVLYWADIFSIISLSRLRLGLLFMAILVSALSVVYVKDLNRRFFIEQQILETAQNQIQVDWGRLLLEQGAWSAQSRVQELASSQLGMRAPLPQEIVLVKIN